MIFFFLFNFCRYSGASGNGVAFGKVWGYPKRKTDPFLKSTPFETIDLMYHMIFYMFFSIFAVTAAPAATAADRTEKLPVLGVVLLKRSHHAKNQPNPSIIVARAD